ncbi:hypothetical protein Val02_58170 [Virgisporangium aliadipatigenens]|uniref:RanBP2-type domain-containing protein n=1 Tax=Virgisporangium aliadipatigenens TaxID=741659 RepID=A0A8J3YPC5_9ACTN|nr:hypothetical protein [Virgisporangium aliadipatigenens]GIJ48931.1 hypothetical protein Val02_58170 [Virgisporangium aliadipatigenens]
MTDWTCTRCGSANRADDPQCASCAAARPENAQVDAAWTTPRTGPAFQESPGYVLPGFEGLLGGGGQAAPREVPPDPMPPTGEIRRSYDLFTGILAPQAEQPPQPPVEEPTVPLAPAGGMNFPPIPPPGPFYEQQPPAYVPQPMPQPAPQPLPPQENIPPARSGGWPTSAKILVGVLAVALVALAAFPLINALGDDGRDTTGPTGPTTEPGATPPVSTAPATPSARSSPSPSGIPARVGLVTITAGITHPGTVAVATTFDTFFAAVNNRDYDKALAQYDPTGVVNTNDRAQVDAFKQAVSTTFDSKIVLQSVADASGQAGAVSARVTFQSQQQPGFGPKGREQETCTAWDVTYTLTQSTSGSYRILRSTATSAAC